MRERDKHEREISMSRERDTHETSTRERSA